jgi:hypothetical protein
VAALIGAALVLTVGVARMGQLRRFHRAGWKDRQESQGLAEGPTATSRTLARAEERNPSTAEQD